MKIAIAIPARLNSGRLKEKMLLRVKALQNSQDVNFPF